MVDRPPTLAVLTHGYYPRVGGIERQRSQVTPLLQRRGLRPIVVTRAVPGTPWHQWREGVEIFRTPGFGHRTGPGRWRSLGRGMDAALYLAVGLVVLLVRRPDIIHTHEFLSTARLGLMAGRLLGVPVISTAHLSGSSGDVGRSLLSRRRRRLLRRIRTRSAVTIAVSHPIRQELIRAGFPERRLAVVLNGVDVEHFRPAEAAERATLRRALCVNGDPLVVFAGRLERQKRVDVLVSAWHDLSEHGSTSTLLILGAGSEADTLTSTADDSVRFEGPVDDTAPFLRAGDVFVLPSDAEGLSNALLEAQASGLPAVVTDVGAARDVVRDGITGLLVPPGDRAALGDALHALVEDRDRRVSMGRAARQRMLRDFSLERTVQGLMDIYENVIGRPICPQD